jgi:hypothetical protein
MHQEESDSQDYCSVDEHNAYLKVVWRVTSTQASIQMTGLNLKFGRSTGSESMRIDDLGNLLVGRSSAGAAATDDGHVFYGSGQHYIFLMQQNVSVFMKHLALDNK